MAAASTIPPPVGGDRNRGPALIAIFWTECVIALVFLSLRCYARILIGNVGKDDWIMFAVAPLFLAASILTTIIAINGGARHLYYLSPSQVSTVVKFNWANQPFAIAVVALGKISAAFLVLRILHGTTVWRKWFLYGSMSITVIAAIVAILILFVQCSPPRALWDAVPGAKCWDASVSSDIQIMYASWNAFFDLALALMPITIVWNLHMKLKKKVGLCVVLGLGVFACISSAIKASKLPGLDARSDLTWATYDLYVWGSAEMFIIVVLGSVPTLKPIYDRFILKRSPDGSTRKSGYPFKSSSIIESNQRRRFPFNYGNTARSSTRVYSDEKSDEIGLRGIRVRNEFGTLTQGGDIGKNAVVGQNLV